MSGTPRLPGLFHVGWVVGDCAAAQEELTARLGAGPFMSVGEARFDGVLMHGKPASFALRIAFGALGRVLLELLEPLDDRSPHAAFLATHGEGLHHLAFLVTDFDEQLAAVRGASDTDLLIDGTGPGNPVRWAYVDASGARGAVIELLERTPRAEAIFSGALGLVNEAKSGGALPGVIQEETLLLAVAVHEDASDIRLVCSRPVRRQLGEPDEEVARLHRRELDHHPPARVGNPLHCVQRRLDRLVAGVQLDGGTRQPPQLDRHAGDRDHGAHVH
jgi:hypothetical protein